MKIKHEINTDAAAGAAASAAASRETTVKTVVKPGAAAEAAAPAAPASVSISCFMFISNFQFLIFDLNFVFDFVTSVFQTYFMTFEKLLGMRFLLRSCCQKVRFKMDQISFEN